MTLKNEAAPGEGAAATRNAWHLNYSPSDGRRRRARAVLSNLPRTINTGDPLLGTACWLESLGLVELRQLRIGAGYVYLIKRTERPLPQELLEEERQ